MAFKNLIFLTLLISNFAAKAQRERLQSIDAQGVKSVYLMANEVFNIEVKTNALAKNIQVATLSEGEYFNDIALLVQRDLNTLQITSTYKEILTSGYDKLSAHKVYAVSLKIIIPENIKLTIVSNIANVKAKGKYKFLEAQLKSGNFKLSKFSGRALVNTFTGNVSIKTTQAQVNAVTNHGNKQIDTSLDFGKLIEIKSIYGDIEVIKTQ